MKVSRGSQQSSSRLPGRLAAATQVGTLGLLALAGCGGSSTTASSRQVTQASAPLTTASSTRSSKATAEPSTTASTSTTTTQSAPPHKVERAPPNEKIVLASPAINPNGGLLQARYTCDGQDVPLSLKWEGVPPGTAELMIDVMPVKPVNGKLQFAWGVMHVPPTAHQIMEGKLPPGAIVGTNSNGEAGYHLCPSRGPAESYVAAIFALPHKLSAQAGFDPRLLRRKAEQQASYQNLLIFSYQRR